MGVVAQIWGPVKAGVILLLASKQAATLTDSGQFVGYLVGILTLLLFVWLFQDEFLLSTTNRFAQFDSIRQVAMSIAQLFIVYFSYVLAAAVTEWFESNYMNGPYVFELVLAVVMLIFIFTVAAIRFTQYSTPQPRHIEHLRKISDARLASFKRLRH